MKIVQLNKLIGLSIIVFMVFIARSNAQENIAIVYLSRTKNTEAVAKIIQEKVGGNLVEIKKENPYPKNYQEIVAQVARENETGFLPPLKTRIENLEEYDIIFVGFPTWDMQMPPPMKSFLKGNDLTGKTLIPFNTNAGFGVGQGFEQLKDLCPESKILEGFSIKGGYEKRGVLLVIKDERAQEVEDEVNAWLKKLGFKI